MKRNYIILLFIIAYAQSLNSYSGVYIIVHGTWASKSAWSKPGGDFFDALEAVAALRDCCVVSYTWSGKIDNKSRQQAAKGLAKLIASYPQEMNVFLVCHSHGVNVGILACKELENTNRHIAAFYALAAPVNTQSYMPPMNIINYFYSFFSFNDLVQTVLGVYWRIYPEHPHIANLRVFINGMQPDHSQLHHPLIAQLLIWLQKNTAVFDQLQSAILLIDEDNRIEYLQDIEREQLIEDDLHLSKNILMAFRKKRNK